MSARDDHRWGVRRSEPIHFRNRVECFDPATSGPTALGDAQASQVCAKVRYAASHLTPSSNFWVSPLRTNRALTRRFGARIAKTVPFPRKYLIHDHCAH